MGNMMKIKQLQLQNYGRFENLTVDFAPTKNRVSNVTVIVGNNGAGKSQILQALATGLSWFVNGLTKVKSINNHSDKFEFEWTFDCEGVHIPKKMIKNNQSFSEIELFFNDENSKFGSSIKIDASVNNGLDIASYGREMNNFEALLDFYRENIKNTKNFNLPLLAFYSVERNVSVSELEPSLSFKNHQFSGYLNALNAGSDYSQFFQWFRDNEDLENEINKTKYLKEHDEFLRIEIKIEQLEEIQEHIDDIDYFPNDEEKYKYSAKIARQIKEEKEKYNNLLIRNSFLKDTSNQIQTLPLKFVRQAIEEFTEFKNIRIQRQDTPTMIIEKDSEELDVNQLSQGEKSLLALVGDIARRLAILNPSLDDPLHGEGVVMIDEVDLHLHPKWQHDLIDKLVKTFPKVQFILTTHSPLIVSDRQDILVYSLDNGELQQMPNVYGEDANTLLNDIFDVPARTPEIDKAFNDIRRAISHKELESAESQINNIAKKVSSSNTELLKVRLMLAQAKLTRNKVS